MKATIQRVANAKVKVKGKEDQEIDKGLLVYVGFEEDDNEEIAKKYADKILKLRIFEDENKKMNLNIDAINGSLMIISQFTLLATFNSGNRPSYHKALEPKKSKELYEFFCNYIKSKGYNIATGEFQNYMEISYTNLGPVTLNM